MVKILTIQGVLYLIIYHILPRDWFGQDFSSAINLCKFTLLLTVTVTQEILFISSCVFHFSSELMVKMMVSLANDNYDKCYIVSLL